MAGVGVLVGVQHDARPSAACILHACEGLNANTRIAAARHSRHGCGCGCGSLSSVMTCRRLAAAARPSSQQTPRSPHTVASRALAGKGIPAPDVPANTAPVLSVPLAELLVRAGILTDDELPRGCRGPLPHGCSRTCRNGCRNSRRRSCRSTRAPRPGKGSRLGWIHPVWEPDPWGDEQGSEATPVT